MGVRDLAMTAPSTENRRLAPIRIGIIGIGVGATEILPAMEAMEEVELVAGADIDPVTRERFVARYPEARAYASAMELCHDPRVEAVWVSSPNRFHAEHAVLAACQGRHVIVEKPMATSLYEAERMVQAAADHGVVLIAGHTMGQSAPIKLMRQVVASGELGSPCAVNIFSYTDWMLRPRSTEELDLSEGGGIPYRQGPHQVDAARVLAGGKVRSVRASVGQWMPQRPIPGYYAALLDFEGGASSTLVHNGYGYFGTNEMVPWGSPTHHYSLEDRTRVRAELRAGTRDEDADKQEVRIGGSRERARLVATAAPDWLPSDLGVVIVSCERGDLRHGRDGVLVYNDGGLRELGPVMTSRVERPELLDLYRAVRLGGRVGHDGAWGMATLEVCLGIMRSSSEGRDVTMHHQVAFSDEAIGAERRGWGPGGTDLTPSLEEPETADTTA
jgi:phthalate 4,5-cis-dihydrodiol dehydrogenase